MQAMRVFQAGQRVHLVDKKGRHYAFTLKAGDRFQHSGETILHDDLIGQPDGSLARFSEHKTMVALMPTLAEYTLKMPRGAQVLYPKDIAVILMWADVYPGARVFEAGVGSAALTLGLLRAVGDRGTVVGYEQRADFASIAMKNIEKFRGPATNLRVCQRDAYDGIGREPEEAPLPFDRVILGLPEPWRVVPHVPDVLRLGGIYLSFVPTVPQVMQTMDALRQTNAFGMLQTFETFMRPWNIEGRSVRPDLRMIAHSGFITVARRMEPGMVSARGQGPVSHVSLSGDAGEREEPVQDGG